MMQQPAIHYGVPMLSRDSSDNELLQAIADGNHAAFTFLIERHHQMFYRVAFRFMQLRDDAEDVVQEAFLKLWERPDMWDSGKNNKFTTWFYRVVVNLCLDKNKKKKPLQLAEDYDVGDERHTQEEELEQAQEKQQVEAMIAELPERQRVALTLCFDEGLSNQEAAEVMQLSVRALRSLLMRAKDNLKKQRKAMETAR